MMFLDCPAYLGQDSAARFGLPAEISRWFTTGSTDGPRAPPVEVDQRLLTAEQRVGPQVGTAQGILGQQPAGPGRHTAGRPTLTSSGLRPMPRNTPASGEAAGTGALHRPSGTVDLALPITQISTMDAGRQDDHPASKEPKNPGRPSCAPARRR
jgi:hypothetical protein